jgi:apolipoprotein D and lipocalin family protein
MRLIALLAATLLGNGCVHRNPPPTVSQVDLGRYVGTWHEVARLPNGFQRGCVGPASASYRLLPDGRIEVLNRCQDADGRCREVKGTARVVSGSGNARLKVRFFGPIEGDYWIHALDANYRWALVGHPSRNYLWILARSTSLDPRTLAAIVQQAESLGYDTSRLEFFNVRPPTRPQPHLPPPMLRHRHVPR